MISLCPLDYFQRDKRYRYIYINMYRFQEWEYLIVSYQYFRFRFTLFIFFLANLSSYKRYSPNNLNNRILHATQVKNCIKHVELEYYNQNVHLRRGRGRGKGIFCLFKIMYPIQKPIVCLLVLNKYCRIH